MPTIAALGLPAAMLWCFCLTTVSAVMPWVNAEIIVLTFPAVTDSSAGVFALVLVATAGQMVGKCGVYWAGRRGITLARPALARTVTRWSERARRHAALAPGLVLLSSTVGLPPFYVMSLVAGATGMPFRLYLVAGTLGRLIRFTAIAFGSRAVLGWW